MTTKNDITGDSIKTKDVSQAYRDNYDLIFNKKEEKVDKDVRVFCHEEAEVCQNCTNCSKSVDKL